MKDSPIPNFGILKLIVLIICFSTTYHESFSQIKKDIFFNTGIKWAKNHEGVNDFEIKEAFYFSENNKLVFEFTIFDDEVIFDGKN